MVDVTVLCYEEVPTFRCVGSLAANHILNSVRGRWEVGQMAGNAPALRFWTKVIGAYPGDIFSSAEFNNDTWQETLQTFDNTLAL